MVSREWGKGLGRGRERPRHTLARRASRVSTQRIWLWKTTPKLREMDSATALRSSVAAEFLLHRGDRLGRDAAGDDEVEVAEVGVDVEGEAVGGDEAGDVDADGGELGFGARQFVAAPARRAGSSTRTSNDSVESLSSARDDMRSRMRDRSRRRLDRGLALWGWRSRRRCASGLLRGGGRIRLRREFCVAAKGESRLARADPSTPLRAGFCVRPYTKAAEVEDGIADDLAGAVEGDVAAAVAFEELDAALGEEFG